MSLRSFATVAALSLAALSSGCATAGVGTPQAGEETIDLLAPEHLDDWAHVGPGRLAPLGDGTLRTEGGMGLFYYADRPFRDFVLELEWLAEADSANSGVYVRIPEKPADPRYAVDHGYEIQIYDPDVRNTYQRTGAIYLQSAPFQYASKPIGEWNEMRIEVRGQHYQVFLNGEKVNEFYGSRGREGYIGLQNHADKGAVRFRNVRVTPLPDTGAPESLAEAIAAPAGAEPVRVLMFTATQGFRHKEAIEAQHALVEEIEGATEFEFEVSEDLNALTPENLARYDVLFLANATLGLRRPKEETDTASENLVSEAQREAIRSYVAGGGGLAVAHAGLDAFHRWPTYKEIIGSGTFESHPWTQPVKINIEEPDHPAVAHMGDSFWIRDEIYILDQNPRWNSRVLLSLDMPSAGVTPGSADASRDDYPISWVKPYGEGRVFVTKLGHFGDVWRNPLILRHMLQGLRIAAGTLPAELEGRRVKETIASDVWPADLVVDERGNVWIAELTGKIHRYDARTRRTDVVAEIPTTDPTKIEHGLYGIELDPDFYEGEPQVYVYYAQRETFINTLSRFWYGNGRIDLASEEVILRVPTEPACCHQAGDLEWGPDGTLFISTGDTGQSGTKPTQEISEERIAAFVQRNDLTDYHWSRLADSERTSQNLQELRGKILRINRDGSIPRDNPFYGQPGVRWEIYAYGLRNPYRFKYDDETGRLYIGVVGPDAQYDYDEYNVSVRGGENFGWPRSIGRLFYNEWTPEMIPRYTPPMWEYTYLTGSRSASGGPMYRSRGPGAFPEQFQDKLFIYDWSRAWIKYADVVDAGTFRNDTTADVKSAEHTVDLPAVRLENIKTFDVLEGTRPISLDVGPDGCIYVAEFAGFWGPGEGAKVSRYCWEGGDGNDHTSGRTASGLE